ncbi:hypothetical protein SAMN05421547_108191 [Delftia lacustris]|mgnify:CR=1|uniref:Uncharacterized protein n=1 Tax=Delftia lacustris TaxID=558537 RepID=A0A1H3N7A9_9BURK|nr:hypothetical protein SAMN05421547_108191 [Delftia lacustris]
MPLPARAKSPIGISRMLETPMKKGLFLLVEVCAPVCEDGHVTRLNQALALIAARISTDQTVSFLNARRR